jgi:hypothetical protein
MRNAIAVAALLLLSGLPARADQVPGGEEAAGAIRSETRRAQEEMAQRRRSMAVVRRASGRSGGAAVEPPYAAQVSCHYSMGGSFSTAPDGQRTAVLAGRYGGHSGVFEFTSQSVSFKAGSDVRSGSGVVSALNAALVDRAHAVDSFDPGSMAASRCGELLPPRPITDY